MVIFIEPYAPRTMLILGAAISGGDAIELARSIAEADSDDRSLKGESDE